LEKDDADTTAESIVPKGGRRLSEDDKAGKRATGPEIAAAAARMRAGLK
jgi:hypothetical protein